MTISAFIHLDHLPEVFFKLERRELNNQPYYVMDLSSNAQVFLSPEQYKQLTETLVMQPALYNTPVEEVHHLRKQVEDYRKIVAGQHNTIKEMSQTIHEYEQREEDRENPFFPG